MKYERLHLVLQTYLTLDLTKPVRVGMIFDKVSEINAARILQVFDVLEAE